MFRIPTSATLSLAFLGLAATGPLLSGCVVAAGGTAVAGYAVLAEDLSPKQQLRDYAIKAEVQAAWGQFNQELAHRLDATVFDGQVLITGRVPNRRWREEAVRRARGVADVRRVFDNMEVGPDTHFIDSARDTWITTELRGELIADIDIKSINYVIKTSDRVVYVMGVARGAPELDKVIAHARTVAGVRRVTPLVSVMTAPEGQPDVNATGPGAEEPLPPDQGDNEDMDEGPGPDQGQRQETQPGYAPARDRGTIKVEPLP